MSDVPTPASQRPPEDSPSRAETSVFAPLDSQEAPGALSPCALDNNPRYLVARQFHSEFLPDDRDVLVYLPEAYVSEPERRFPVFYLHDGQNLFDGRTSYVVDQTWRAHATADALTREALIEPLILVGVNNTGMRRMPEYTPTRDQRFRGGEGDRYGALLVEELKPLIDSSFRTLTGPEHTGIGGSSLGGLISLFLGLRHSDIFGRIAALSPSVWWDNRSIFRIVSESRTLSRGTRPRIWLDMGTAEGLRHLRDTDLLHHRLRSYGWRDDAVAGSAQSDLRYLRVAGGLHNEAAWATRFDQVLRFLFPPSAS